MKRELAEKVLPYWYDTAQDRDHGGYLLADSLSERRIPTEKQIVTQSRMVWGFSHAHRFGFSTARRNYLEAAKQGYRFLMDHFLDHEEGGFFWSTDLEGNPRNTNKIMYGNSFVIYGLVEYYRASRDQTALQAALDLYRTIQRHAHDDRNGGWIEHFTRDWQAILEAQSGAIVEVPGLKSANTHLHLMEAFTELYDETRSPEVKKSLEEAVRLNAEYFYPRDPGRSCFHRQIDWEPVTDERSAGLSYGHNVEFAWLMIRAQKVLEMPPAWDHFYAHLDHALRFGYDHERGGLYNRGLGDEPASERSKIWWVQSEMLAALTDALGHRSNERYAAALEKLIGFIWTHQLDPRDAIWLDTVTEEGKPKSNAKAHNWKANYHDLRAVVKFINQFGSLRD